MIYKDSLESIIEALYLDEFVSKTIGKSNIRVNPVYDKFQLSYTIGKTIILNDFDVDPEMIKQLVKNNTIISRIKTYCNIPGVLFQPYITRVNFNVMWNGETFKYNKDCCTSTRSITEWIGGIDSFDIKSESHIVLYFPKIIGINKTCLTDSEGNLTSLGWLLHQVGQNIDSNSKFRDLDLLKTKKILL